VTLCLSPKALSAFAFRGWEEAAPCASKLRKARWRHSLIAHHVSLLMDGPDHLGKTVGPGPGCLRHFASRGWEEAVLVLQSYDGEEAIEPNRAPRVPLMDGPDHLGKTVGPGPGRLRHFASRGWEEAAPCASKLRKARRR
jgi:hypothetical protein